MTFREEKLAIGLPQAERQGTQYWFKEGTDSVLHREGDLPAVEHPNGGKEWWWFGERHRSGGLPALVENDGHQEWWEYGKRHRENDLPAVEYANGYQAWWDRGQRHRAGGKPAIIIAGFGGAGWFEHGVLNRLDGPAIRSTSGRVEWYIDGEEIKGELLFLLEQAASDKTPAHVLGELSHHSHSGLAKAAAHNPRCPLEDRIEWCLS